MASGNDRLFDFLVRHQIGLQRLTKTELKRILKILAQADADVTAQLERRLKMNRDGTVSYARLQELLNSIQAVRKEALKAARGETNDTVSRIMQQEPAAIAAGITTSIGAVIELATVEPAALKAILRDRPIQGATMKDWFDRLSRQDMDRVGTAIRLGIAEGETIDQITARLEGAGGAFARTQANLEAIARTGVNEMSNAARDEFFNANSDIIEGLRWTATLDGRTSAICRARDGKVYPLDSKIRPPAHWNCRSVMVPVIDGEEYASQRPYVRDTRTGEERQVDFAQQARENLGRGASKDDVQDEVRRLKQDWARKNVGQVSGATNYNTWLGNQPAAFQDEVLGKEKGALFRRGGLTMDQFVDMQSGKELTLEQLYKKWPDAFSQANVGAP